MTVVRRKVPWQKIDNQVVVIAPHRQEAYEFNPIASELWEQLGTTGTNLHQLTQYVVNHYEIDETHASSDVEDFLDYLSQNELIEASNV